MNRQIVISLYILLMGLYKNLSPIKYLYTYIHIRIYILSVYFFTLFMVLFNPICRLIPLDERSRAVSFVFGGLSVGSVTGYVALNLV